MHRLTSSLGVFPRTNAVLRNESPAIVSQGRPPFRRRPTLREASFDDCREISALHQRNGLPSRLPEQWLALWKGNPAYEQHGVKWPIGWVLQNENGGLVGSIGNLPIAYTFRRQRVTAAGAISWVVDPDYRQFSMLLLGAIVKRQNVDFSLSTTVSANAEPGYRTFNWSRVPAGAWDTTDLWVTDYQGFLHSVFQMKAMVFPRVLSYPAAASLFIRDRIAGRMGIETHGSRFRVEVCSDFDHRFDDFWKELETQNENVMLAVRSRETLEWHFRHSLVKGRVWMLVARDGARLGAYAICKRQDNPAHRLKRLRVVDFQALRGFEGALPSFLAYALKICRNQGVHVLESVGGWLTRPGLPEIHAPYRRKLTSWAYYYKSKNEGLREALKDPSVWAPSLFDGDASL
jgi:hypothetical protein